MKYSAIYLLMSCALVSACGGGDALPVDAGGNITTPPPAVITAGSLNQAAYVSGTTTYKFGHNSIPNMKIVDAPDDTDYTRSAMLHDGSVYRLYFFKQDSNDTIYQFGFNSNTGAYQFGHKSIPQLKLTNVPDDADTGQFAMLHDGSTYRLYLKAKSNAFTMYQFGFNGLSYDFGYKSIPVLFITGAPADVDHSRWAMLHDGSTYRLYLGKDGNEDAMYQFGYHAASSDYEYGYNSITQLSLVDTPTGSYTDDFAMLHDGSDYRFYYLAD